jgi:four helix bundle protein
MSSDGKRDYNLEERTFQFALSIRECVSSNKWTRAQWTDIDQMLRASGSVAANYVEANNAVSKGDFLFRIKVSKKEASECRLWLRLLGASSSSEPLKEALRHLYRECDELVRILAAILRNSQSP